MNLFGDLKSPALIYLKAALFLVVGALAAAGLLCQNPTLQTGLLLAAVVWASSRLQYFVHFVLPSMSPPRQAELCGSAPPGGQPPPGGRPDRG